MFRLQMAIKKHIMKAALKRGVETGTLVMVKSSYKVSAEAKKPAKKPAAAKVAKSAVKKVRCDRGVIFGLRFAVGLMPFTLFAMSPTNTDDRWEEKGTV